MAPPHGDGGNSLNNVANLHIVMPIRNTEFSRCYYRTRCRNTAWPKASPSTRTASSALQPGLGTNIDFDLIERKKVGVLSPIALSQQGRPQPLRPPDPRRGERRKALPAALSRSRLRMTVLLKNRATNP
jgi:hypothetical protein